MKIIIEETDVRPKDCKSCMFRARSTRFPVCIITNKMDYTNMVKNCPIVTEQEYASQFKEIPSESEYFEQIGEWMDEFSKSVPLREQIAIRHFAQKIFNKWLKSKQEGAPQPNPIPHCPNKELSVGKCKWRGNTCFLCDDEKQNGALPCPIEQSSVQIDIKQQKLIPYAVYGLQIRPAVIQFAIIMEQKLQKNDHKGGWKNCDVGWLIERISDELAELRSLWEIRVQGRGEKSVSDGAQFIDSSNNAIIKECADVANFAMMVADILKGEQE